MGGAPAADPPSSMSRRRSASENPRSSTLPAAAFIKSRLKARHDSPGVPSYGSKWSWMDISFGAILMQGPELIRRLHHVEIQKYY